ncbi:Oidioi.mRNA.OKI2018_I69.PAR.g8831.t1.cds [Oikopleura dioica]|uniref:Oidioi.mRNA.OKI2018_I69.PAR.g8831.t1.cds n=1 Tax=Oikopleura dioica TaxID=34765 RepID=A0ABN7RHV3_OIKDI|nr:Oidioi.mRNA.OKI2018_I69.PAR.g8831.t1.cds [Oikopleura dioica]
MANNPAAGIDASLLQGQFDELREEVELLRSQLDEETAHEYDLTLVMNACMVLFMQSGFALLEAGAVRAKNVTNILIKNLLDACVGALVYWACGFAFAFGKVAVKDYKTGEYSGYSSANQFIGHKHFFLSYPDYKSPSIENYPVRVFHGGSFYGEFFFNFVFAATATTIISGALAERVEFGAYLVYGVIASGFIQPVTVHWAWSNGWLVYPPESLKLPPAVWYRDYAGGGNVHAVGGIAALVSCIFIGPRLGRFSPKTGRKFHIPGHSTPLTCLGAFILFIGFLSMVLGHGQSVAQGVTNLTLGGSASGLTSMMIVNLEPKVKDWWKYTVKKANRSRVIKPRTYWSFLVLVDATLAGMVSMCAGCDVLEPWGAVIIGVIVGFAFHYVEHTLVHHKVDDPVGSVAVHLVGGVIGVLLAPVFAKKEHEYSWIHWKGCDYDCVSDNANSTCLYTTSFAGDASEGKRALHPSWSDGDCLHTPFYQFAWQLLGIISILAWTIVCSIPLFFVLWKLRVLRVDADTEVRGIDIAYHGEPAYPLAAQGHGWDNEGEFAVNNVVDGNAGGRRDVKALLNPHEAESWVGMNPDAGLVALAIAYREKYYKNPDTNVRNAVESTVVPSLVLSTEF